MKNDHDNIEQSIYEFLSFADKTKLHLESNPQDTKEILKSVLDSMENWERCIKLNRNARAQNALNEMIIFIDKKKLKKGGVPFILRAEDPSL